MKLPRAACGGAGGWRAMALLALLASAVVRAGADPAAAGPVPNVPAAPANQMVPAVPVAQAVGAALRRASLRGRAALRGVAMWRLGMSVNSTLTERQRRQLEEEGGLDLSIIMLISIFGCLFAYPCCKLVPIAYRSTSQCYAFLDEYWPWCRKRKKAVVVPAAKAPEGLSAKKGRNKAGHVSRQKAHMFWDD